VHFCEVVGRPDLATRGDWSTSMMDNATNDMELREELIKIFASKTRDEWTELFLKHNIAGGPYYDMVDLPNVELFKFRQMFAEQPVTGSSDVLRTVGVAIKAGCCE
jgi:crotonobetainyl-CoA:carnitine CoA-transferase CaiB-like acyl-CoA transferase